MGARGPRAKRPAPRSSCRWCACAPEGGAAAALLRQSVPARLSLGSAQLQPGQVTDADFMSPVCLSLRADWSANVAGIFMDQWFLVVVERMLPSGV